MISISQKYKGIHPGIVLERELNKQSIKQRPFALLLDEHPQTFNAILKGKRSLPTDLALKIEKELNYPEGELVILQAYYDIEKEKNKNRNTPNTSIIRKTLFWDTDFEKIDWDRHSKAIIHRVFDRGNEEEKNEIIRFYGKSKVKNALSSLHTLPMTLDKSL